MGSMQNEGDDRRTHGIKDRNHPTTAPRIGPRGPPRWRRSRKFGGMKSQSPTHAFQKPPRTAVGSHGTILATRGSATSWEPQKCRTYKNLSTVHFCRRTYRLGGRERRGNSGDAQRRRPLGAAEQWDRQGFLWCAFCRPAHRLGGRGRRVNPDDARLGDPLGAAEGRDRQGSLWCGFCRRAHGLGAKPERLSAELLPPQLGNAHLGAAKS